MFKSILVPIDLADTDLAKPAIATAATLSQTWSGTVRLLNVLPMTPVMLAEYVPADFDAQQRQTSEEALAIVARESGIEAARISSVVRQGGIYHEILEEAAADQGRPDRDDLAPAGDADLFSRLQCRPCGALRQMLGAGGAALNSDIIRGPTAEIFVKNWWRKWTHEIPLALRRRAVGPAGGAVGRFLNRLTIRRALEFFVIAVLVMAFVQTLPIDLAILFAGDTLMYLEILVALRLAAGWGHIRHALRFAASLLRAVLRLARAAIREPVSRINRLRARRTPARQAKTHLPDRSDDDGWSFGTAWGGLATA